MVCPEELLDKDLVFHYTRRETAIEHILTNGKLRFSSLQSFSDPYENSLNSFSPSFLFGSDSANVNEMIRHYKDFLFQSIKVACFTQFLEEDINLSPYKLPFIKPRQWAQYGQAQTGVCLGFSKQRLIESVERDFVRMRGYRLYKDAMVYDLDDGQRSKKGDLSIGPEGPRLNDILSKIEADQKDIFFRKYRDFRDENEFRVVLVDPSREHQGEDYCRVYDALKFIILGDKFPPPYEATMKELAEFHNVELLRLRHMGADPRIERV